MLLAIVSFLLPSLIFVFTLIEAIREAVAGRTYWQWAVVSASQLAILFFLASISN